MRTFDDLVGKTISKVQPQKLPNYDDEGFLRVEFTDGTHCTISGGYSGYTGGSEDEYPTVLCICSEEREAELVDVPNGQ